jgi:uncharacterized protein (TIGR03435 family)
MKISLDNDKLKAMFYSIDQPGAGVASTTMTRDGSNVKITLAPLLGTYEGKMSADGNLMTGTWSQGGAPLPLSLARATAEAAWVIPDAPPPPPRMAANADPAFTVATIKPSEPGRPGKLFTLKGPDVLTINTTLSDLITMAYDLHPRQISGAPAWIESDKFDVTGRPDVPGQPSVVQMKTMIQKMLADRFQLKFHRDKKELSVYAITVAKTGAKITKSQSDPNGLPGLFFGRAPTGTSFNVRNATLAEVATVLQGSILDKPVVDQTGLSDKYDFTLTFTPDGSQMALFGGGPPPTDNPDAAPDVFTAFQQQLGLKLESTKAPAGVLVIDRVEKPSAN